MLVYVHEVNCSSSLVKKVSTFELQTPVFKGLQVAYFR